MLYERIDKNFEPSSTTLEACLFLRKKTAGIAGITHPGLHGVHGVAVDVGAVILVILLELVGMFLLVRALAESDFATGVLIASATFAILTDFALAFFHHRYSVGLVTKLQVQRVVLSQSLTTEDKTLASRKLDIINSRTRIALIFAGAIVVFAVIKFYFYYATLRDTLGDELQYAEVGVAFFVYALSAYIHVTRTGYALAWAWASHLYKRDVDAFKKSSGQSMRATPHRKILKSYQNFEKTPSVGEHELKAEQEPGATQLVYVLTANGLLLDSEIEQFTNKLTDAEAQRELALKAMEIQLTYIDA